MADRTARATGTISWSDGTLFNGFALIGLRKLTDGSAEWADFTLGHQGQKLRLPKWQKIPIADGAFNQDVELRYNADISPPGSQYVAFYYDSTKRAIGSASAYFSVASSTVAIPTVTLTAPVSGGAPTPDT